jgi:hypothetical protein
MVLQLKRCTDLGIIMKKLKLPWPQVADAILKLDPVCLASGEDVQTLEKCLPSDDERKDFQVGWVGRCCEWMVEPAVWSVAGSVWQGDICHCTLESAPTSG